jgi:hypothetical protein
VGARLSQSATDAEDLIGNSSRTTLIHAQRAGYHVQPRPQHYRSATGSHLLDHTPRRVLALISFFQFIVAYYQCSPYSRTGDAMLSWITGRFPSSWPGMDEYELFEAIISTFVDVGFCQRSYEVSGS